jgi:hypothetical protein
MKVVVAHGRATRRRGLESARLYESLRQQRRVELSRHAEVGPDGAVWVADFQNFIIQHNPTPSKERGGFVAKTGVGGAHENDLRDHSRGRIYRIVKKGYQWSGAIPQPQPAPTDVLNNLGAATLYNRLNTQKQLIEEKVNFSDGLHAKLAPMEGAQAIHALWTLHGLGILDAKTHQAALISKDAKLRRNAIRALGNDKTAQDLFFGSGVFSDPDLHTRLAAFVKLADFPTTPEIQTLVKKLAADSVVKADEWLAEAAKMLGKKHKALNYKEGPNLLPNPGFEELAADKKTPVGWKRRDYGSKPGNKGASWGIVIDPKMVHSGKHGFRVITREDGDTSFFADVAEAQHRVQTHRLGQNARVQRQSQPQRSHRSCRDDQAHAQPGLDRSRSDLQQQGPPQGQHQPPPRRQRRHLLR